MIVDNESRPSPLRNREVYDNHHLRCEAFHQWGVLQMCGGVLLLHTHRQRSKLTISARAMYRNIPPAIAKITPGAKELPIMIPKTRPR